MRRMGKSTIAPNMLLQLENIIIEVSRKALLSVSYNNQKFFEDHYNILKCTGEANTMAFCTVLDYACTGGNVCNNIMGQINMYSETTKSTKQLNLMSVTLQNISAMLENILLLLMFR